MRALLLMLFEAGSFMLQSTSLGADNLYCIVVFMISFQRHSALDGGCETQK
jgi:hypothetical protein